MAIIKSAKKAHRRSIKLRARNLTFKLAMKKAIKDLKRGIEAKEDPKVLMGLLSTAYSEIDKAKKRNIINKNNAARKKSRLNAMVKLGVVR